MDLGIGNLRQYLDVDSTTYKVRPQLPYLLSLANIVLDVEPFWRA